MEESMFDESKEVIVSKNFIQKVKDYISPNGDFAFLSESDESSSSGTSDKRDYSGWILPLVSFTKCQEFYLTVGKVQNTVESFINQVINRDWYFDGDSNSEADVQKLKDWETKYHLSILFENIVRDWLICGNSIIGKSDYLPVQIESIVGLKRDSAGIISHYGQASSNSSITPLDSTKFFHSKYIGLSRSAWGLPLYNSLMTSFTDIDGRESQPLLALYRQSLQDNSKIHHRMGSPKSIWFFDVAKEILRTDIKPLVKRMKNGDRLILNKKPEMISEQIDGQTRFTEATKQLNDEVETGLQSSSSRLITQPSAMADAKEAGSQDDERVKGIMEKLRRFMDEVIIPQVLGKPIEKCNVSFKWGTKDSFSLNYPDGLRNLLADGIINKEIVRHILTKRLNWDIPEDLLKKLITEQEETKTSMKALQSKSNQDSEKQAGIQEKKLEEDSEDMDVKKERLIIQSLEILLNKVKTD